MLMYQPNAIQEHTAARGARAQGADGVHSASWGNPRGGGRAGGRLKPEIMVTIRGDRPPRLGGEVVAFADMREFRVAYSECEKQMHITNQDAGDSATQVMVVDELYDGKPVVDLSVKT